MSLAFVGGTAVGQPVDAPTSDAELALASIGEALERNEVARVEVLNIPARIFTRTRLSPEMLNAGFYYKFVIRDLRTSVYREDIANATRSLSIHPQEQMADLRWGVTFYRLDESPLAAIYFDGKGSQGAVNGIPVSFRGDLFRFMERQLSHAFR